MRKKGQITIFIIIGLIILGTVMLFTLERNEKAEELRPLTTSNDLALLKSEIQSCVDQGTADALLSVGLSGDAFSENNVITDEATTAYYFLDNTVTTPSLEELRKQLSEVAFFNINLCLTAKYELENSFTNIYDVTYETAQVIPEIREKEVKFTVNIPVDASIGKKVVYIEKFISDYQLKLPYLHRVANDIVTTVALDPRVLPVSDFLKYKDLSVDVFVPERELEVPVNIIKIEDLTSNIKGEMFTLQFALEMSKEEYEV